MQSNIWKRACRTKYISREFKSVAAVEFMSKYAKLMYMDVDIKTKIAVGDSLRVGLEHEGDDNRKIQQPLDMSCIRNATNGRKLGDEIERDVDQQMSTERHLILEDTEDSPQSTTGTA